MSTKSHINCPNCNHSIEQYKNPTPTVDVIIVQESKIILIERANEPYGWALPGGFVDYGETLEAAAIREILEETNMRATNITPLGAYSDPARDPRQHTITFVFVAFCSGDPRAGDDAKDARWFPLDSLPSPICFDHAEIIRDFQNSDLFTAEKK